MSKHFTIARRYSDTWVVIDQKHHEFEAPKQLNHEEALVCMQALNRYVDQNDGAIPEFNAAWYIMGDALIAYEKRR